MRHKLTFSLLTVCGLLLGTTPTQADEKSPYPYKYDVADVSKMEPFAEQVPIRFVARGASVQEWEALPAFWNNVVEEAIDPTTGKVIKRNTVVIKVPLGLNTIPEVPAENPMTVAKWELGKRLYFDKILSTNNTIACATCHNPEKGFSDARKSSIGINEQVGGANSPTVINSAYNQFQFWDGRAMSLEHQAQGPVGNPIEMFAGNAEPWSEAIDRIRQDAGYVKAFEKVFGHGPTQDAAAKAIATYERTVLSGDSLHDRATIIMRKRVTEEETGRFELIADDYAEALNKAFADKDEPTLKALNLEAKDADKAADSGKRLLNGRELFFGKARCSNCHIGDNFTDHQFHNLGVGIEGDEIPEDTRGRFNSQPIGHKTSEQMGAFKTPGLRALTHTGPYMHDGSEKTLEAVIDLYDKGGNANPFLSEKMRDTEAERAYMLAKAEGKEYSGPKPESYAPGGWPIIPFKLKLTDAEKADLVLFMKALNGAPIDPVVADPEFFPSTQKVSQK